MGEAFVESSLDAIRIHGGRGYLTEYGIERDLRDAVGGTLYGGTSDIQRNIVARSVGTLDRTADMHYLIPHILEHSTQCYPDHEAMRFSGQALTYAGWSGNANALARLLIDQGVVRGDRVGILLNKSLYSAIAMYGIMKAGAAYVPLDPSAPVARLAFVIRDCGIKILLSQPNKRDVIRQLEEKNTGLECVIGLPQDKWSKPAHL
jgi:acyl-CoA synthetase (AMP-forming)/AMP-acid ligase II